MPLNGCEITGHFICDTYLWVFILCTVSYSRRSTTVALETRLCKRGTFAWEPKLYPSAKIIPVLRHKQDHGASESKGGRKGVIIYTQAKYIRRLLTIMVWKAVTAPALKSLMLIGLLKWLCHKNTFHWDFSWKGWYQPVVFSFSLITQTYKSSAWMFGVTHITSLLVT